MLAFRIVLLKVLRMSLFVVSKQINVDPQSNSEWSYDQHEGFIVEDVVVDMSGMYTCNALRPDNVFESITYYVSVQRMSIIFLFFRIRPIPVGAGSWLFALNSF